MPSGGGKNDEFFVCVSVRRALQRKARENYMYFALTCCSQCTLVGLRNHVLNGDPDSTREGTSNFRVFGPLVSIGILGCMSLAAK